MTFNQQSCENVRNMAEGTGFEPAMPLRTYLFSRQAHSTTLPPLRRLYDLESCTEDKSNCKFWLSETVRVQFLVSDNNVRVDNVLIGRYLSCPDVAIYGVW